MHQTVGGKPVIFPVASGKGGTGKSTFVANFGALLASRGLDVVIVDCDFGGSNLHLFLNVQNTLPNLSHYLSREESNLSNLVLSTGISSLKIICGGNEMVGISPMSEEFRNRLIEDISFLNADVILIDLGAGTSSLILDLFLSKMRGIVICNPEPQSRVSAYGLLKNIIFRHISNQCGDIDALQTALTDFLLGPARKNGRILDLLDSIMKIDSDICDNIIKDVEKFDFCLILNRFRKRADIHDFERFNRLILNYLSIKLEMIGFIRSDRAVYESSFTRDLFVLNAARSPASNDLRRIKQKRFM